MIMIKERELDHTGLCVTDVETNAKWYQEVLGFKVKGLFLPQQAQCVFSGQRPYRL